VRKEAGNKNATEYNKEISTNKFRKLKRIIFAIYKVHSKSNVVNNAIWKYM
jgi:hypothetical protein